MVGLRQLFRVFGRGSIEFLQPKNGKVLAHVRRFEQDVILCVANLSRLAQPVELDLSAFAGLAPIEMLGYTAFPPITDRPYSDSRSVWLLLVRAPATRTVRGIRRPATWSSASPLTITSARQGRSSRRSGRRWPRPPVTPREDSRRRWRFERWNARADSGSRQRRWRSRRTGLRSAAGRRAQRALPRPAGTSPGAPSHSARGACPQGAGVPRPRCARNRRVVGMDRAACGSDPRAGRGLHRPELQPAPVRGGSRPRRGIPDVPRALRCAAAQPYGLRLRLLSALDRSCVVRSDLGERQRTAGNRLMDGCDRGVRRVPHRAGAVRTEADGRATRAGLEHHDRPGVRVSVR